VQARGCPRERFYYFIISLINDMMFYKGDTYVDDRQSPGDTPPGQTLSRLFRPFAPLYSERLTQRGTHCKRYRSSHPLNPIKRLESFGMLTRLRAGDGPTGRALCVLCAQRSARGATAPPCQ